VVEPNGADQHALLDRYVAAFEAADVAALMGLLREDAQWEMPPLPAWFAGRADIGRFLSERMFATPWRLVPTGANGQLAFACYQDADGDGRFTLGAINVLTVRGGRIAELSGFVDPALHRHFDLPRER
jgi:ketosteroid isomerase-like protein